MMYCVDLRSKITYESVLTIFKTDSHSLAWTVANNYNRIHGNTEDELEMLNNEDTEGWTSHPYWATVYDDNDEVIEPKFDEVKRMKKYTIEYFEEFCRNALQAPPIEEFEAGTIDEGEWYKQHNIHIITGEHDIELEYHADNVNEIEYALKEMYEVEMDIRSATTGNTVGSEYRPAEFKDVIRVAVQHDWNDWGYKMSDFGAFIREFVKHYDDISNIFGIYDIIYEDVKHYTDIFQCNFGQLNMYSMRRVSRQAIIDAIKALIGTDMELLVGYDNVHRCSDITFVMDHTLKDSGELIGWFYGEQDKEYIDKLFADYKKKLFEEEN